MNPCPHSSSFPLAVTAPPLPHNHARYDSAGNLIADGSHTYTYDAENRLISVDNGNTSTFTYDGEGHRFSKTNSSAINSGGGTPDPSGTTEFVYDAQGRLVHTENPNGGNGWRADVYAGNRHLATYTDDNPVFHHTDWLGTSRLRTDYQYTSSHGFQIGESCTSLPFGDATSCRGGANSSPLVFTGKELDNETGLDYFGARYYASAQGRFLSADPGNTAGELNESLSPQSWNAYSYVRNNPLNLVDPDGLDCIYSGDFKNSGTVLIERGDRCSYSGGTYVNGTVDEKSLIYDEKTNQLTYNFSNEQNQTGGSGEISLGPPRSDAIGNSDRFDALIMGVGLGEQGVNWAIETTISNAIGSVVGGILGEAFEAALSSRAANAVWQAAVKRLKSLSPEQYKLVQEWVGKIHAGDPFSPPPPGLSREAMEAYLGVAKAYLEKGGITPGGMATQIARVRALQTALGHP